MSARGNRSRQGTAEASQDWLPHARESPLAAREAHSRFAQSQRHRDWFMALICAMEEGSIENNGQSKMLFKMYVFMRDFFPRGLAGTLGHIRGSGVMGQLLCHGSSTASKHRVTKAAHVAFEELEKWMAGGEDWRAAFAAAKDDHQNQLQKKGSSSRSAPPKDAWKAPGLHSPEGLMAVLVISHPDDKFKVWIGRLQIQWMMMQDPKRLTVRHGFWKGLTSGDVNLIFNEPEARQPQTELLADYDVLFGEDFRRCRKDIRPYLPAFAAGIPQISPSDLSDIDGDEDTPAGPEVGSADPDALAGVVRMHLTRPTVVGRDQLEVWLADALASSGDDVLLAWCRYWAARSEQAMSYMEQKIVQDLFLQSTRRAFSIAHTSQTMAYVIEGETTLATAYMLADMADGKLRKFDNDAEYGEAREQLGKFSEYIALCQVNDKLARAAMEHMPSDLVTSLVARVSESLTYSLVELVKGPELFSHWRGVFLYEVARTRAILQNLDVPDEKSRIAAWWRSRRDQLLMDETLEPARLTNWQIRSMLWPGADCQDVLTAGQDHLFRNIDYSSRIKRELRISPVSVPLPAPPTALSPAASKKREEYATFFSLFADIPLGEMPPAPALERPRAQSIESRKPATAEPQRVRDRSPSRDTAASERGMASTAPTTSLTSPSATTSTHTTILTMPVTPIRSRAGQSSAYSTLSRQVIGSTNGSAIPNNPFVGWVGPKKRKASSDMEESVAKMPVKSLKTILDKGRDLQGEDIKRWLDSDREALQKELQSLKKELQELRGIVNNNCTNEKLRKDLKSDLDQLRTDLKTDFASLIKPPVPALGGEGYLRHHCQAPPGWQQDVYEGQLERAVWSYIAYVGDIDDSDYVGPHEGGMDRVGSMFPGLRVDDIVTALNHVHMRSFRRPFGWPDDEQEAVVDFSNSAETEG